MISTKKRDVQKRRQAPSLAYSSRGESLRSSSTLDRSPARSLRPWSLANFDFLDLISSDFNTKTTVVCKTVWRN